MPLDIECLFFIILIILPIPSCLTAFRIIICSLRGWGLYFSLLAGLVTAIFPGVITMTVDGAAQRDLKTKI